jgi:uncharacterized protein
MTGACHSGPVPFACPPESAAWTHHGARRGFEVAYFQEQPGGWRITGCTTACDGDRPWCVTYAICLDAEWATQSARVTAVLAEGPSTILVESDGQGAWRVDGDAAAHLDGCLDVDLESSAMTNAFPVHRLALSAGSVAAAPAVYVRSGLSVERLEQHYARADDDGPRHRYHYASPRFCFESELVFDESGRVLVYPGIAARAC